MIKKLTKQKSNNWQKLKNNYSVDLEKIIIHWQSCINNNERNNRKYEKNENKRMK
jgi:hypothetical protein